jgi:hypothetical protein
MGEPQYELTLAEAIPRLEEELAKAKADPDRNQLTAMSPDDAYDEGYGACLTDLKSLTGPNPARGGALETLRKLDPKAAKDLEDRYK